MKRSRIQKNIFRILAFCVALLLCGSTPLNVKATETLTGPMVVVDSYQVTNEKIVPGEDFTLTLTLKN